MTTLKLIDTMRSPTTTHITFRYVDGRGSWHVAAYCDAGDTHVTMVVVPMAKSHMGRLEPKWGDELIFTVDAAGVHPSESYPSPMADYLRAVVIWSGIEDEFDRTRVNPSPPAGAAAFGLAENVGRRRVGRRRVVATLCWYDPDAWTPGEYGSERNVRAWKLQRSYASPLLGGDYFQFEQRALGRWPDGGVTESFDALEFHKRFYLHDDDLQLDDDDLRALGIHGQTLLRAMWARLHSLSKKRTKK